MNSRTFEGSDFYAGPMGLSGMGAFTFPTLDFGKMLTDTVSSITAKLPEIGADIASSWAKQELMDALDIKAVEEQKNPDGSKTVVLDKREQPVQVRIPPDVVREHEARKLPGWVVPAAIGGGALLVGGLVLLGLRR